jgi:hypothetical protein
MENLNSVKWQQVTQLLHELADMQQHRVLQCAQQVIPQVTADDILQPNDFPALEMHPLFRYEEGLLAGIQSVQMALHALQRDADA